MSSIEDTKSLGPAVARPYYSLAIDTLAADPVSLINELVDKRGASQFENLVAASLVLLLNRQSGVTQSVTEQGAVGDGTTDDTEAIQAAIDAVSAAGGGTVTLPPGVYLITETIELAAGVTLKGSGVPSTIIRGSNMTSDVLIGTTVVAYASSPTIRAPEVRDLIVDNIDRDNAGAVGIEFSGVNDGVVKNVTIQNVETGLRVTNSSYWNRFMGVRIAQTDTAIEVTQNANHNTFLGCHALATDVGVHIVEGADAGVSNTYFVHLAVEQFAGGANEYALHMECSTANTVDQVTFLSPRIENASSGGTGVICTGTVRALVVEEPQFINVDTETSGLGTDAVIRWRAQEKGGLRIGVVDDYSTAVHGLMVWSTIASRVLLRNSANSTYVPFQASRFYISDTRWIQNVTGTPEGALTAPIGCMALRDDGGASTTLYVKESGTGNTGWVAK